MGGTALAHLGFTGERVNKEKFDYLSRIIPKLLLENKYVLAVEPIKCFQNKISHGDIDLNCLIKPNINLFDVVQSVFAPQYISKNHNTVSFNYDNTQIDISGGASEKIYHTSLNFCHYSPFGNIFSRTLKQLGVKFGNHGLSYPLKFSDSEQLGEIELTRDINKIIEFGGLEPKIWNNGFENQTDIFNYVISSPLFNVDIFRLENLNHTNKKRDKVRKDYNTWLDYIGARDNLTPLPNKFVGNKNKTVYLSLIEDFFPESNLQENIEILKEKYYKAKEIAAKFNGNDMMEISGLSGAPLGKTISEYKKNKDWANFILTNSKEYIQSDFREFLKNV